MGGKELTIKFKPSAQDYRRILIQASSKFLLPVLAFLFLLSFSFIFAVSRSEPKNPDSYKGTIIVATAILLPLLVGSLMYWGILRQSKKLGEMVEETQLTFTDFGIESLNASTETRTKWERFQKVVETNRDFVIYPQENIFYPIPKTAFEGREQVELFRTLLANQLGLKAKLKG